MRIPESFRRMGQGFFQGYYRGFDSLAHARAWVLENTVTTEKERLDNIEFLDYMLNCSFDDEKFMEIWGEVNDSIGFNTEGYRLFFYAIEKRNIRDEKFAERLIFEDCSNDNLSPPLNSPP